MDLKNKLNSISPLIGNTPLVNIVCEVMGRKINVFSKCEMYNLSGSIKDRCVINILDNAIMCGLVDRNTSIFESSSGNTGISLASICAYIGVKANIVLPKNVSSERKKIIAMYGANVFETESGIRETLNEMVKNKSNVFLLKQFENIENVNAHYFGAGIEIINQCRTAPDCFCAGVGTGGTFMGVGKRLKEEWGKIELFALQSENVNLLNFGNGGEHKLQGLATEFTPDLYNKNLHHEVVSLNDNDCIYVAQQLAKKLGLGVGITSGANLLGVLKVCYEKNFDSGVTVFPDDNKKYLSTALSKEINPSKFAKNIKLLRTYVL